MSDNDTYEDDIDESLLEDSPVEEEDRIVAGESLPLDPDITVYRLRLPYANETFLAIFPGGTAKPGDQVVVPTRYGRDLARVLGPIGQDNARLFTEVARIDRNATADDLARAETNLKQEADTFNLCQEKIEDHGLDMRLISVHYLLEEPKILFFFFAETRVDFRDLVRDLVVVYKTRIELRQIGVRDEARILGGLGICGRDFCCHGVSDKLKPVSIKMAKDQNLSLNSIKISGPCDRLLCCLAYEHSFYSEQRRLFPPDGCRLDYEGTLWKVTEANVVTGKVTLVAEDGRQLHLPQNKFERVDGRWQASAD
ncbi:MAG: hypothetical protein LBT11_00495 [Treponema sp.]|jgi:cell fate regulator YaaT (PSP1 superfamily)|nr:hypothetical protein [Treponema sp.]